MKRALITGITGQDGDYLAKLLLDKGYKVFWWELKVKFEGLVKMMVAADLRRLEVVRAHAQIVKLYSVQKVGEMLASNILDLK